MVTVYYQRLDLALYPNFGASFSLLVNIPHKNDTHGDYTIRTASSSNTVRVPMPTAENYVALLRFHCALYCWLVQQTTFEFELFSSTVTSNIFSTQHLYLEERFRCAASQSIVYGDLAVQIFQMLSIRMECMRNKMEEFGNQAPILHAEFRVMEVQKAGSRRYAFGCSLSR